MKKLMLLSVAGMLILTSCVSKKEFMALETKQKETQDLLNSATVKLNKCLTDEAASMARLEKMKEQLADMRKSNQNLIDTQGNLTTLTQKGAENLEKSLESLKERDLKITRFELLRFIKEANGKDFSDLDNIRDFNPDESLS